MQIYEIKSNKQILFSKITIFMLKSNLKQYLQLIYI